MHTWSPAHPPHQAFGRVGVLVTNLGTPDAPTAPALRRYLREFLSDHRVIDLPRWKWLPILHLFVLTTRPRKSAALYREIWTDEGSPLLIGTRKVAAHLGEELSRRLGGSVHTAVGMRYGNPSIRSGLRQLAEQGCDRILIFPLYGHYSATSTASTYDAVFAELATWRRQPELRTQHGFHDEPGLIRSLAASIREVWATDGPPDRLLLSYHGIPRRYFEEGDPYFCLCHKTSRLVAEELNLAPDQYQTTFQSLFGREEWLKPYTDATVTALGRQGGSLDVVCPGFSLDCLETLEEIDGLNRKLFEDAGGGRFRYIPCLNDRPDHLEFLSDLAERHLSGWTVETDEERQSATEGASRRAAELASTPRSLPG